MAKYIIGDIHGSHKSLVELLEIIKYNSSNDSFIFLGDYVDGYPQSKEVLDLLIKLSENKNNIFLLGNHDQWLLHFIRRNYEVDLGWFNNGGFTTLDSFDAEYKKIFSHMNRQYKKAIYNAVIDPDFSINSKYEEFLLNCKTHYIDEDNNLFVHGGFNVHIDFNDNTVDDFLWDRDIWTRLAPSGNPQFKSDGTLPKALRKFKEIFIGHTACAWNSMRTHGDIRPMNYCNVWNLDTGCGSDGKLCAMNLETKEFYLSNFSVNHYPDHKNFM